MHQFYPTTSFGLLSLSSSLLNTARQMDLYFELMKLNPVLLSCFWGIILRQQHFSLLSKNKLLSCKIPLRKTFLFFLLSREHMSQLMDALRRFLGDGWRECSSFSSF